MSGFTTCPDCPIAFTAAERLEYVACPYWNASWSAALPVPNSHRRWMLDVLAPPPIGVITPALTKLATSTVVRSAPNVAPVAVMYRSEEHTSELQSLMRMSY